MITSEFTEAVQNEPMYFTPTSLAVGEALAYPSGRILMRLGKDVFLLHDDNETDVLTESQVSRYADAIRVLPGSKLTLTIS